MTQQGEPLDGQYPESWDEYVGQAKAVRQLKVACLSAQKRGVNLGHVLLKSPFAGIGKTALALLVAREMDTPVWVMSGSPKPSELRLLFAKMEDGDILFYDEIHKAVDRGKAGAEWLLHYLENGVLMGPLGPEAVPRVTIIGATTDAGKLPAPILQRFEVQPELVEYTTEEAARIVVTMSRKLLETEGLPPVDEETARAIAEASSNRPRWMRRLLSSVRDLAILDELVFTESGKYDVAEAFEFVGVTPDGLTVEAQAYLRFLYVDMRAQPTGKAAIAERLGEVGDGLAEIEQLLAGKGLIAKTKTGRMLTGDGLKRARALAG
jgi:Holliday junction DNA helicase RuvB